MQSTNLKCEVPAQLSTWLHGTDVSQELKIRVWPEKRKVKDIELCFLYVIQYIWIKPRTLNSSQVQMVRILIYVLM